MLNLRFTPKRLIVVIPLIFVITIILFEPKTRLVEGIKDLTQNFDFLYLSSQKAVVSTNNTLDLYGYQLEPQNVKFKFLESGIRTEEEELKLNTEAYEKLFQQEIKEPKDFNLESIRAPAQEDIDNYKRANATILSLVRNHEAPAIARSIRKFEKRFNHKFRYPYTFINDQPFTEKFKQKVRSALKSEMNFVLVSEDLWKKPDHIDLEKEKVAVQDMKEQNVAYADKALYHNMCRFYLGNFYNVPELQKYKYYWRIEPDVEFYSDINYDVFKYLQGTGKLYGFSINLYDIFETVRTLWPETLKWLNQDDNYKYVNPNGAHQWLLTDLQHKEKYDKVTHGFSTCHFWLNFEIADMDFYRGDAYNNWFKHLDKSGGFYYERWGDAPVHLMGLALFADTKQIHWFRDIGYFHDPYFNCPNTPLNTGDCIKGKFLKWDHLGDQNCMAPWLRYVDEEANKIY